jgi:tRNA pseudouridine38-40 synthase
LSTSESPSSAGDELSTLHGVCLVVAYDGTEFHGWARQPGTRTVQGVLEDAVSAMSGQPTLTRGAGRTDRGVHAMGQVVGFDSARAIPPEGWLRGLNQKLPGDVVVRESRACAPGYNPRFDAVDKTYRYVFLIDRERDPLLRHRAWHLPGRLLHPNLRDLDPPMARLDLEAMRQAAQHLHGTHDFRAFRAADDDRENSVRTIHALELTADFQNDPRLLAITVRGSAFMKNMVRILAGTLLEVGRGKLPSDRISNLLGPLAKRENAGQTAPPEGLTLLEVRLGRQDVATRA